MTETANLILYILHRIKFLKAGLQTKSWFANTLYLIFSTSQQLFTIRAESQTGDSSTVSPQKCMRLNKVIVSQITQQPQCDGEVIYFNGKYKSLNNKTAIDKKCYVFRRVDWQKVLSEKNISCSKPEAVAKYVEFCANAKMTPCCTPNTPSLSRPPSIPASPSCLFQTHTHLSPPPDSSSSASVLSRSTTTHIKLSTDTSKSVEVQIFLATIKVIKRSCDRS